MRTFKTTPVWTSDNTKYIISRADSTINGIEQIPWFYVYRQRKAGGAFDYVRVEPHEERQLPQYVHEKFFEIMKEAHTND